MRSRDKIEGQMCIPPFLPWLRSGGILQPYPRKPREADFLVPVSPGTVIIRHFGYVMVVVYCIIRIITMLKVLQTIGTAAQQK